MSVSRSSSWSPSSSSIRKALSTDSIGYCGGEPIAVTTIFFIAEVILAG